MSDNKPLSNCLTSQIVLRELEAVDVIASSDHCMDLLRVLCLAYLTVMAIMPPLIMKLAMAVSLSPSPSP